MGGPDRRGESWTSANVRGAPQDPLAQFKVERLKGLADSSRDRSTAPKRAEEQRQRLFDAISEAVASLSSMSAELLAGTAQQAAGAHEQAAAVAQTVSTMTEVTQTAEQASDRARAVAELAQRTVEIGKSGRAAVDESIAVMGTVKDQAASARYGARAGAQCP